jgi:hypothetical protein
MNRTIDANYAVMRQLCKEDVSRVEGGTDVEIGYVVLARAWNDLENAVRVHSYDIFMLCGGTMPESGYLPARVDPLQVLQTIRTALLVLEWEVVRMPVLPVQQAMEGMSVEVVNTLESKNRDYGQSWKRRGGIGAFMMLARKWDRIHTLIGERLSGVRSVAFLLNENRGDVLDDIRDLRGYLLLVEDHCLQARRGASVPWPERHLQNGT